MNDKQYIEFLERNIKKLQSIVDSYQEMFASGNKEMSEILGKMKDLSVGEGLNKEER